jgi:predicted 3-demethylubiquinone-9 3-methyltransferase (glyoxalase superfamily)
MNKMIISLWFDNQAEEAMNFYVSVFKDAKAGKIARYTDAGPGPAGSVLTTSFTLNGMEFIAINGGPLFTFSEAVGVQIMCDDQAEVDYYWSNLLQDGGKESRCGWLKDKFGFSWQVIPKIMSELMSDPETAAPVTKAMLEMVKLDIAKLKAAAGK